MQRIAAYCRVSTDSSDQANSLHSQKRYFEEYISRRDDWILFDVYADEGITGTSTKKRAAFNRMISDACDHKFDLIVTKEISRFARNTLDSIFYTRRLKEYGVGVFFLNDNINTLDADAELRLTIMSSIAQEESRRTSQRVKWGQQRRMEQGVVFGRDMLGYDVRGGKLFINKDGAETVRLIFHKFTKEGKGAYTIARELTEEGIKTAPHMKGWSNTAVLRILKNEKYCGDLIQKKTITPNYLTHAKKYNRGEEAFVVLRDHHEGIISREVFDEAQCQLAARRNKTENGEKYSNRYTFSGKIKCGSCGLSYVQSRRNTSNIWRCSAYAKHGRRKEAPDGSVTGCDNKYVSEGVLKTALTEVLKEIMSENPDLEAEIYRIISFAIKGNAVNETVSNILNAGEWDDAFYRGILQKVTVMPDNEIRIRLEYMDRDFSFYLNE